MKIRIYLLFSLSFVIVSCGDFYTMDDFSSAEKIDAHFHVYGGEGLSPEQAEKDNFKLLSINTNSGTCDRVVELHQTLRNLHSKNPTEFAYSTTFCMDDWDEPGWTENTIAWIDQCVADGANSVKVWKNIGMEFRDENGKLVMIDDPQFDAVFAHLSENNIPLVAHMGEPRNCWLPFEEMTTKNDSSYFANNPQYHMFKHPEFPSYEQQMAARDQMLDKNPNLIFIGCHLASLEWSVDELGKWLDKHPNAAVDMAARMGQLFYQTREDRENVRQFFIDYQDRILYGTDVIDRGNNKDALFKQMHENWIHDWEYLCTKNTMTSSLIDSEFKGLQLPKEVVDKIYSGNVKRWYKSF